ncbi:potassium channel family protein [Bacillus badius]|uniref:Potassium voltage-gated channel subfamily KQT n=1 Tax=Bacillus badius TaxID=1455 RepID=A0ABR5AP32_BACBA|nr:potassium channel protein [Bacillus badius]KIL73738.1 Potassium voltage-gated channel subfamily KQT [Bacillus badius]MED4718754.1 NAD-binding protein [Bacillus badius]
MLQSLYYRFVESPILLRIFIIAVFFITLFGTAVHIIEPATFPTVFEGIWWAVVTASTVGFGDYAPKTTTGRILGIGLIFAGAGFLSAYFINLAASAVTLQNSLREGKAMYTNKNHLVIVGWNERTKEIIDHLHTLSFSRHIVLVDESLGANPYSEKRVHFIQGAPYKDETLKKANIKDAATALVTSDQNKNEMHADMNSILTLVAIKGSNPSLHCIVEILTNDQVVNAERAGADEIIQTNKHASSVMLNSIQQEGVSSSLMNLMDPANGGFLKPIMPEKDWIGAAFGELAVTLLKERTLLIGIQREGETFINPPLSLQISQSDELLVIQH